MTVAEGNQEVNPDGHSFTQSSLSRGLRQFSMASRAAIRGQAGYSCALYQSLWVGWESQLQNQLILSPVWRTGTFAIGSAAWNVFRFTHGGMKMTTDLWIRQAGARLH